MDLTYSGASQLLPSLPATEIWIPGLHHALHRRHTTLSKGIDTQSLGHTAICGPRPAPSAGWREHRAASGSKVQGAAPSAPTPSARAPAPAAPSGTQPSLTSRLPLAPPPRCSLELPAEAWVTEPPTALGCGLRVQPGMGGGLGPKRPSGGRRGRGREAEELGGTEPL